MVHRLLDEEEWSDIFYLIVQVDAEGWVAGHVYPRRQTAERAGLGSGRVQVISEV
jgi:hypothetical protein